MQLLRRVPLTIIARIPLRSDGASLLSSILLHVRVSSFQCQRSRKNYLFGDPNLTEQEVKEAEEKEAIHELEERVLEEKATLAKAQNDLVIKHQIFIGPRLRSPPHPARAFSPHQTSRLFQISCRSVQSCIQTSLV